MANRQRSSSSAANCADGLGAIIPFTSQGGLRGPDFSQPALSALVFRSSPAGLPCALSPIQDVGKLEGVYLFSQSCDFDFIQGPSFCQYLPQCSAWTVTEGCYYPIRITHIQMAKLKLRFAPAWIK